MTPARINGLTPKVGIAGKYCFVWGIPFNRNKVPITNKPVAKLKADDIPSAGRATNQMTANIPMNTSHLFKLIYLLFP